VLDAIVFDFDGLVLDTETSAFTTAAEVFEAHGVTIDAAWWATIIGTAEHPHWSEVLEEALGGPIPERDAVLAERLTRHHGLVEAELAMPGVVELLGEAATAGVPCAVASSSPRAWVERHLTRLELRNRFAAIACREDVEPGRTKPAPDLYVAACDALGVAPARSVALEDSPNGLAAAVAAGLATVGVPAGMTAGADLSAADLVVPSLVEIDVGRLTALVEDRQPSR
jgi:HAD superfamily hydrolase (TIGR01509 family)